MFLKPSIAVGTSITNVFDTYTCVTKVKLADNKEYLEIIAYIKKTEPDPKKETVFQGSEPWRHRIPVG